MKSKPSTWSAGRIYALKVEVGTYQQFEEAVRSAFDELKLVKTCFYTYKGEKYSYLNLPPNYSRLQHLARGYRNARAGADERRAFDLIASRLGAVPAMIQACYRVSPAVLFYWDYLESGGEPLLPCDLLLGTRTVP